MKKIIFIIMLLPFYAQSQRKQGIVFRDFDSWKDAILQAKVENKYIFVDCFATWCGPCKQMESDIFTNDSVARIVNQNFVSIKLQFDSTQNDSHEVKKWRGTTRKFLNDYDISGFPTYLFFSPSGEIVHKDVGGKNIREFVDLLNSAMNIKKQNYLYVKGFKEGLLNCDEMKNLSLRLKNIDEKLALQVAKEYMHSCLEALDEKEFCSKENLDFLKTFYKMLNTNDKVFKFFYKNPAKIDMLMNWNVGTTNAFVCYLVFFEEVTPALKQADQKYQQPDWSLLLTNIKRKYPKLEAENMILGAKVNWFKKQKNWEQFCKFQVQQIEDKGLTNFTNDTGSLISLNGAAWDIFLHSSNEKYLATALLWADKAINIAKQTDPNLRFVVMDTKANLLYKLNRKVEAIALYKEVVKNTPQFKTTLEKMEMDLPTW